MTQINKDDHLHKAILLATHYISHKMGGNSVYYLFADELKEIQKKYLPSFKSDDILESIFADEEEIENELKVLLTDMFTSIRELGERISPLRFMVSLHLPLRAGAPQWFIIIREAYHFVVNKIVPQYLEKFTKSFRKINLSSTRDTNQIRKLNIIMYDFIYKIIILLYDILAYTLEQYEEHGDPLKKIKEINEQEETESIEAEKDDDDDDEYNEEEYEKMMELERTKHDLKVNLLANSYIELFLIQVLSILGTVARHFLFTQLANPDEEATSDNLLLLLLTICIYVHIFLSSLYKDGDVYRMLFVENRILANNFIQLLSVFIEIYEMCGSQNLECIENDLVDKIYANGRNSHYVSIGLSAYS